jgi:hypothetical protein
MPPKSPRSNSSRTVPASDLYDRTLGVGDPRSASKAAGKAKARYSKIDLTGATGPVAEFDVPHDLGETPTLVELKDYENASGPVTIAARGVRQQGWSHSHVFVEVTLLAGSFDGTTAWFSVQGR